MITEYARLRCTRRRKTTSASREQNPLCRTSWRLRRRFNLHIGEFWSN